MRIIIIIIEHRSHQFRKLWRRGERETRTEMKKKKIRNSCDIEIQAPLRIVYTLVFKNYYCSLCAYLRLGFYNGRIHVAFSQQFSFEKRQYRRCCCCCLHARMHALHSKLLVYCVSSRKSNAETKTYTKLIDAKSNSRTNAIPLKVETHKSRWVRFRSFVGHISLYTLSYQMEYFFWCCYYYVWFFIIHFDVSYGHTLTARCIYSNRTSPHRRPGGM